MSIAIQERTNYYLIFHFMIISSPAAVAWFNVLVSYTDIMLSRSVIYQASSPWFLSSQDALPPEGQTPVLQRPGGDLWSSWRPTTLGQGDVTWAFLCPPFLLHSSLLSFTPNYTSELFVVGRNLGYVNKSTPYLIGLWPVTMVIRLGLGSLIVHWAVTMVTRPSGLALGSLTRHMQGDTSSLKFTFTYRSHWFGLGLVKLTGADWRHAVLLFRT